MEDPIVVNIELSDDDPETFQANVISLIKEIHKDLSDSETNSIQLEKPTRGLMNRTYCLKVNGVSKKMVLRINGKNTEEYMDRDFEYFALCFLSKISLAPKVLLKFKNGMISEFCSGKELTPEKIANYSMSKKIAVHLAYLHKIDIEKVPEIAEREPFILKNMKRYYNTTPKKYSRKEIQEQFDSYFGTKNIEKNISEISSVIEKDCRPMFALGHNDLVVGNFLHDEVEDKIQLIDFEFAEKNFKQSDIANFFLGSVVTSPNADYYRTFSPEGRRNFVKMYLEEYKFSGEELEKELDIWMKELPIFEAAGHLIWCFWALFQAEHSPRAFDFIGYAIHKHMAFESLFENKDN
ncbi:hypothetical protein FO519_008658 [Halicephalobus sp. NKZ332]|nr:hypothetical protein FO519_008658 [Halicephalobus sp. NKZ332]